MADHDLAPATAAAHVEPGAESWVTDLGTATVRKASVSGMDNNIYLITCRQTGAQALIDAADDPHRIDALVTEGTGDLETIITTHRHWDHHRALAPTATRWAPVTLVAGAEDAGAIAGVTIDRPVQHGDSITVGALSLRVIGLRGHTPGSIAVALVDQGGTHHLFTGDSLFPGGPGKTGSSDDFLALMDDLEARVFAEYDDDTTVHPGHGDSTTVGAERGSLQEWRARGW